MSKLIVLRGMPGSGKSTWAREWVQDRPEHRVIVSRDGFREMFAGEYTKAVTDVEDLITSLVEQAIRGLLREGKDVCYDATNLPFREVRKWLGIAESCGAEWEVKDFSHVELDTILRRVVGRGVINPSLEIPEAVLLEKYNRYIKGQVLPRKWEPLGRSSTFEVEPYVPDPAKPNAILVDIDGTLARMNGRGPHEYDRVGEDEVIEGARDLVEMIYWNDRRVNVILVSGRPESCRDQTKKWLVDNNIPHDDLLMRSNKEKEAGTADDIVKARIFDEHIRESYNVLFAVDDRDRVVSLWRQKLGIHCFQANYGDF